MSGVSPEDFDKLQTLLDSRAGYRLPRERVSLVEHRLGPVARREGYDSVPAMLAALWARPIGALGRAVIDSLLNPETWFRRDRAPFETLARDILPALSRARGGRTIRIWCAGCSTGQEAYSIAMAAGEAGVACEITATDLNPRAIEKARSGDYTTFEIQRGLSAGAMLHGFEQVEDVWRARPELRGRIAFAAANILDEPADDGRFDIIFCRNLIGEMSPAARGRALDVIERRLVDDGCLFLGRDERIEADTLAFRAVADRRGLFVKAPAAARHAA
ncbi:MAG: protein-glutamate O-methyltransferase CheR [Brevundimonas sp.]|uniref:CheR family methyltransferase n=1 Tax=Brevundimonas sp. TaxID=1871086 RepID=UPI0025BA21E1|nr:protein-glutamate O-methyltransferase CheR [Brevundimonas sp.]MBX3478269.1 protein-glutamate O-methyltransferase CheR [Brevundimonas sp.]